jgi:cytochrome c551
MRLAAANFFLFCLTAWACGQEGEKGIQDIKDLKTKQYAVAGKELYLQHCANCHQKEGSGLGQLIPPLKGVGYSPEDAPRIARAIRYGVKGEIMVNGIKYNQPMPANPQLKPLDIAKITTYVISIWGKEVTLITADEVNDYLN